MRRLATFGAAPEPLKQGANMYMYILGIQYMYIYMCMYESHVTGAVHFFLFEVCF